MYSERIDLQNFITNRCTPSKLIPGLVTIESVWQCPACQREIQRFEKRYDCQCGISFERLSDLYFKVWRKSDERREGNDDNI